MAQVDGSTVCKCDEIMAKDPTRHFRGCPKRAEFPDHPAEESAVRRFFKERIATCESTARDLKNRGFRDAADLQITIGEALRDILGAWSRETRSSEAIQPRLGSGIFIRIERDGAFVDIEVEDVEDYELTNHLSKLSAPKLVQWCVGLAKALRGMKGKGDGIKS
jgi:hypothetical protein